MSRIDDLVAWLDKKPGDRFALYSLALEHRKAGDFEASERMFRDLLELHPTSGAGHLQYGQLLLDSGRIEDAALAWRAGLRALRDVDDPEAHRSRAEIERALAALDDET